MSGTLPSVLPADILRMRTRNTHRAPINPLDKCTVVSIFPKSLRIRKATIQPGLFQIPKGTLEAPGILVVGSSSWWKNVDIDDTPQPLLEIPVQSPQIAEALVKDYCNALVNVSANERPGLFFLLGDITNKDGKKLSYEDSVKRLKTEYKSELDTAAAKQKNWYNSLIFLADAMWANSNHNPIAVPNEARLAAAELNISGKDWMSNKVIAESINCTACGALRNPAYPVCGTCHAIVDKKRAEELGIIFAK